MAIITRCRMPPESWWDSVRDLRGFGDAHLVEHAPRLRPCRGVILVLMQPDRFGNLLADGEHRVERGHRLLEDHGDLGATNRAQRCCVGLCEIDGRSARAQKLELAGDDATAAVLNQPHHRQRGHRLARTGLAHDGDRLGAADAKRHVAHGADRAF